MRSRKMHVRARVISTGARDIHPLFHEYLFNLNHLDIRHREHASPAHRRIRDRRWALYALHAPIFMLIHYSSIERAIRIYMSFLISGCEIKITRGTTRSRTLIAFSARSLACASIDVSVKWNALSLALAQPQKAAAATREYRQ